MPGNHPEEFKYHGGNSHSNNFLAACLPSTMKQEVSGFLLVYPATPWGMYTIDSEDLGVDKNNNKYL